MMKRIFNFRKNLAIFAFLVMAISLIPSINPKAASTPVTVYEDWDFYGMSAPEPIWVDFDIDFISISAVCEGNVADTVTCYIKDVYNPLNCHSFQFTADGTVNIYGVTLDPSIYRIYFVGSSTIKKTDALVTFNIIGNI